MTTCEKVRWIMLNIDPARLSSEMVVAIASHANLCLACQEWKASNNAYFQLTSSPEQMAADKAAGRAVSQRVLGEMRSK